MEKKIIILGIAIILGLIGNLKVESYPTELSTNYCANVLNGVPGGGTITNIMWNSYTAPGSNCVITTDVPGSGYVPNTNYQITVTTTYTLNYNVMAVSAGTLGAGISGHTTIGSACVHGDFADSQVKTYSFTSPSSGSNTISIKAICSKGRFNTAYIASATISAAPTKSPTKSPTKAPTKAPTKSPTKSPVTSSPTDPTASPTTSPTNSPTDPTASPTKAPTKSPTPPTQSPTNSPTDPTASPTKSPTKSPTPPTQSPTNSPTDPTASPTKSPTLTPTNAKQTVSLEENLNLEFSPSAVYVPIKMTVNGNRWIGFGVGTSMSNARVVVGIPNGNNVQLYDLTQTGYDGLKLITVSDFANEYGIEDLAVEFSGGKTTLSFNVNVAKQSNTLKLVGGEVDVIFAYGPEGGFFETHEFKSTRAALNLETGETGDAGSYSVTPALAIHIICMALGWGILLPIGIMMPLYNNKKYPKQKTCGLVGPTWFKNHWKIQSVGVVITLIGLGAIMYLFDSSSRSHFAGPHEAIGLVVMIIAVGQPIYGRLRPHKPSVGEEKTRARFIFEYLHPGIGYVGVFLALYNCIAGIFKFESIAGESYQFGGLIGATGFNGAMGVGIMFFVGISIILLVIGLLMRILGRFILGSGEIDHAVSKGGAITIGRS